MRSLLIMKYPYVTEPEHIPATDLYADVPLYRQYHPEPGEFSVEPEHVGYLSPTQ